ncbi:hypothetical protein [Streptomyces sp. NPDC090994]|uniref:hypothetical protein n=1 Tax=Streptomyces sp. NPDC090994 TaxID=3365969 RepID=UPI003822EB89
MLTPAPHIAHAGGPHGTAVLDIRRATWLMFDADASVIWHAITVRGGIEGLADEIAVPAGQNPQAVDCHIRSFVDELLAAGVLIDTDRPRSRRRWRR